MERLVVLALGGVVLAAVLAGGLARVVAGDEWVLSYLEAR